MMHSARPRSAGRCFLLFAVVLSAALPAMAQKPGVANPMLSGAKSGGKVWRYQPDQINPPRPKFDYADDGKAIMIKRLPFLDEQTVTHFRKYPFFENKHGIEHLQRGSKLKREPDEILTEAQKTVLRDWGQPDYLRGPYKSTRGDSVIEWAYHPLNRLFQFVDGVMVYEGPLTDQERTLLTHGIPREVIRSSIDPDIRRETWFYRPWFLTGHEQVFSFANGKLVHEELLD